jgi:hypothetical protein
MSHRISALDMELELLDTRSLEFAKPQISFKPTSHYLHGQISFDFAKMFQQADMV